MGAVIGSTSRYGEESQPPPQACGRAAVLIAMLFTFGARRGQARLKHTLTGKIRLHRNFHSKFLPADRDVIVYLPPGYRTIGRRRYPVLYMHDGQNLFDGATSFIPGQDWRVDETAQTLIKSKAIEPLIIVGIYNTGEQRMDEYTPTPDAKIGRGGKADLYGLLLMKELKPFIDAEYRTLVDAANTGLGGSSLGGLVSLYVGLKHPEIFGKLAILSPSVWWDGGIILRVVEALPAKTGQRIWLDMGTEESPYALKGAEALHDALIRKGWTPGADLNFFVAKGAKHTELAWAERVDPVLRYLFPVK